MTAAAAYRKRAADKGALGAELTAWKRHLSEHRHEARFGALRVETRDDRHRFTTEISFGGLNPDAVRVELFAEPTGGGEPVRITMTRGQRLFDQSNKYEYAASVAASRPADDYTPRLIPHHPDASVPLEAPQILWRR